MADRCRSTIAKLDLYLVVAKTVLQSLPRVHDAQLRVHYAEPRAQHASDAIPTVSDALAPQLTLVWIENVAENIFRAKELAKKQ